MAQLSGARPGADSAGMAVGRMLERCRGHLRRRARGLIPPALRSKVDARDLVRETFINAARRLVDAPRDRSDEPRAWLYRIMALNPAEKRRQNLGAARADVRREVRREQTPARPGAAALRDWPADAGASPSADAEGREAERRLAELVATRPEVERRIVLWRYRERLDDAEIGRRLGDRSADDARMIRARACRRRYRGLGGEP